MPSWLDRLRGRSDAPPPPFPGDEVERSTTAAVRQLERRMGGAIQEDGTPAERLAAASGRALAGRRSSALIRARDLAAVQGGLSDAASRLLPLVVHAVRGADEPWGLGPAAATTAGTFVAAAGSAAHAADLTVLARALTEQSLVPGVLLHDDAGPEPLIEPADGLLAEFPGRPGGFVDSPTPAQRALFGNTRRRLVRWFDPDHPVALGGPRGAGPAAAAALGRELLFADAAEGLAQGCAAELERLAGRVIAPVEPVGLPGADVAVVAWGRAAVVAGEAAEQLRAARGPKVAVLGLTFLRPFPRERIAALLGKVRAVAVIEPPADPLAPLPPLALEVAAAVPRLAGALLPVSCAGTPDPDAMATMMEILARGSLPRRLSLDLVRAPAATGFPRRDALVGALRTAVPRIDDELLPGPAAAPARAPDPRIPPVLARIPSDRVAPDSLPRFWGEVVQPMQAGVSLGPDPHAAAGVVPAGATALQPPPGGGEMLPVLDSAACTGCGDCWTACPEGALSATVLGAEPLLRAASTIAGTRGKEADALRRSHRHLAARVVSGAGEGEVTADVLDVAWDWLVGQRNLSDDERPAWEAAFSATRDATVALAPAVPTALPRAREELLLWAVDPDACVGCGVCIAACADEALTEAPRTDDAVAAAAARWANASALPDTSGESLAAASEHIGPAASMMLARSCAGALLPSPSGPVGSGARLALRLVSAASERHGQRAMAARISSLHDLKERLEARAKAVVGEVLAGADAAALADAVSGAGPARISMGELISRLETLEVPLALDRGDLVATARTATALADATLRLEKGADGLGRARFAVLAPTGSPAAELLRHPLHPWFAPAAIVPVADAAATAGALAAALADDHLALVQLCRRAKILAKAGSDTERRLAAVRALTWDDLDPAERADAPRLLVLASPGPHLAEALDLLVSGLPVLVVALDDRPGARPPASLALDAMVRGAGAVLASTIGHPDHLVAGLEAMLAGGGPGLAHVAAPDPAGGSFEASALLETARATVTDGEHVLIRADAGGLLDLDGNPDPAAALAGPLVDRLRARFEADLQAAHNDALGSAESAHDAAVAAARDEVRTQNVQLLTDRLLELAGYASPRGQG
ncbi:MAG: hypothetical protein GY898_27905 [Proteobacteria bacterium]|nr:hypothetical protein [Pseudomonadota bacterium]